MFITKNKLASLHTCSVVLCLSSFFWVSPEAIAQSAKPIAKVSRSVIKQKYQEHSSDNKITNNLQPFTAIAPIVSSVMAVIAGGVGINLMLLHKRKLIADVTMKIEDTYLKLETERNQLTHNSTNTIEQARCWYHSHTQLILNEFQHYKYGLVEKERFDHWIKHCIIRCNDINDFIPYVDENGNGKMQYAQGVAYQMRKPEFEINEQFPEEIIKNRFSKLSDNFCSEYNDGHCRNAQEISKSECNVAT